MDLVRLRDGLLDTTIPGPTAIAIGVFDGVHIGHQHIIGKAVAKAQDRGLIPLVLTFEPHPSVVLGKGTQMPLLTTAVEKAELIEGLGVKILAVQEFSRGYAGMKALDFAEGLKESLQAQQVVVGHDFTFGAGGSGTAELLREVGDTKRFSVDIVPEVTARNGLTARSSNIRLLLRQGDLASSQLLLGRPYSLTGTVIHGMGRGTRLGFPTANISVPPEKLLPPFGVYAVRVLNKTTSSVRSKGGTIEPLAGVANLGTNPTFDASSRVHFEVHLLDFEGSIYGEVLEVQLLSRIRGEKRFASPTELAEQILDDCRNARSLIHSWPAPKAERGAS